MQHCIGTSSTRTVQAPQEPSSQPSFVPVRPISSRSRSSKSRLGAAATSRSSPLTRNRIKIFLGVISSPEDLQYIEMRRKSQVCASGTIAGPHPNSTFLLKLPMRSQLRLYDVSHDVGRIYE